MALGLIEDNAIAAQEILAHAKFSSGDIDGGRLALAALLPVFRAVLADAGASSEAYTRALPAALCGGDAALVAHILKATYPHAGSLTPMTVASCTTIEEWCREAGVPCEVVDPPRQVTLERTTSHGRRFTYTTDPILFAHIPGGEWMPGWDFAIAPDGTVLQDSGYFKINQVFNHAPHAYFPAAKLVAYRSSHHTEYVDEDVLLVSAPGHNHVGHWLIDFIPRLQGRDKQPLKIAIPDTLTSARYQETLALAGVKNDDIIRCRPDARYRFRTLHVFRPGQSMPPHPHNVRYLRSVLAGDAPPDNAPAKPKRIFLSRAGIGTRLPINGEEFDHFLRENDFISVDMGALSVLEQRALFADAEVLLGVLGTDLLAAYFMRPGSTVISIQWDTDSDRCAPPLVAMLGMRHQFLLCTTTCPSKNARHALDRD